MSLKKIMSSKMLFTRFYKNIHVIKNNSGLEKITHGFQNFGQDFERIYSCVLPQKNKK